jgi:mRNA interferase RelE/StbE
MASYELAFRKSVARDLRAFPKQDVLRIMRRIKSLADDPRPAGCENDTACGKAATGSFTKSKTHA